ncbi:hypothetical protein SCLCIDRAFT_922505 [Scleroderma citrinum Foug A]|uniref:Uncharacterized protein n=1 Tax=Scleroderma citrinum Foug A TaxID=1036808 RepID=A0A0C2ZB22_9AGAM|nr:hypothetical protein SCLCIDRAFT_922505 [Scleroderma citrinum Foug A]
MTIQYSRYEDLERPESMTVPSWKNSTQEAQTPDTTGFIQNRTSRLLEGNARKGPSATANTLFNTMEILKHYQCICRQQYLKLRLKSVPSRTPKKF